MATRRALARCSLPLGWLAVRHEHLVSRLMHPDVGGAMHIGGVGVAPALVALADLQDELAVLVELQKLVVRDRLEPRQLEAGAIVASDPDEALIVDVDAVLALDPFVAGAGPAPGLDEVAVGIELQHRRCSLGKLVALERAWTVQDP